MKVLSNFKKIVKICQHLVPIQYKPLNFLTFLIVYSKLRFATETTHQFSPSPLKIVKKASCSEPPQRRQRTRRKRIKCSRFTDPTRDFRCDSSHSPTWRKNIRRSTAARLISIGSSNTMRQSTLARMRSGAVLVDMEQWDLSARWVLGRKIGILEKFRISWNFLWTFRDILDILKNFPEFFWSFMNFLDFPKISRNFLDFFEISWNFYLNFSLNFYQINNFFPLRSVFVVAHTQSSQAPSSRCGDALRTFCRATEVPGTTRCKWFVWRRKKERKSSELSYQRIALSSSAKIWVRTRKRSKRSSKELCSDGAYVFYSMFLLLFFVKVLRKSWSHGRLNRYSITAKTCVNLNNKAHK